MPASLDDLLYVASAIRIDLRSAAESLEKKLDGGGSGGGAPPGAPGSAGSWAGFSQGLARLIGLFGAAERAVVGFGNQLSRFVGLANPAVVMRWNLAVADLQAVIGRALIPVLERLTRLVRGVGDAFASLSPQTQKLIASLGMGAGLGGAVAAVAVAAKVLAGAFGGLPVLIGAIAGAVAGWGITMSGGAELARAFNSVLKLLGTVVEALANVALPLLVGRVAMLAASLVSFSGTLLGITRSILPMLGMLAAVAKAFIVGAILVPILEKLAPLIELVADAFEALSDVVRGFLEFLGFEMEEYDPKKRSSVGAAVRQASIGSFESFANRNIQMAYQGSVSDIPRESLGELKGIRTGIDRLPDKLAERLRERKTPGMGTERDAGRRILASGAIGAGAGAWFGGPVGAAIGFGAGAALASMRELFS